MAVFKVRTFKELLQTAIDRTVARTRLTDIIPGSKLYQVLGAYARGMEQLYIETARLLSLFAIGRAQGEDLDERAREYMPDGYERIGATRAGGTLRWERPLGGAEVVIPVGTVVAKLNSNPRVTYVSTAPGRIPVGGTQSERTDGPGGDIPGRAEVAGVGGNAPIDTVTRMISAVPGAATVTNPTPFVGGLDKETDDSFVARIRERTRTLSRCIREALESRAREAAIDGARVTVAKVIENAWRRGDFIVYVDDGTGFIEGTPVEVDAEVLCESATGGERRFFTRVRPLRGGAADWTVKRNGAALVAGTDYIIVAPWGLVDLSETVFPNGLTAGDKLVIEAYTAYGGLIALAQKLIDGDINDVLNFPSWRAAGVVARVLPPLVRQIIIRATVSVKTRDGYDRDTVKEQVRQALAEYVNNLSIGDDVILSELIERAMAIPGMYDILFDAPQGNIPVADNEVARVSTRNLIVE